MELIKKYLIATALLGVMAPAGHMFAAAPDHDDEEEIKEEANNALWKAVEEQDIQGAATALAKGANINIQELWSKDTPLVKAANVKFDIEMVKFLIKQGACIDIIDPNGTSILIEAIFQTITLTKREQYVYIAKILIAHGANLDIKDKWGRTALNNAILLAEHCSNVSKRHIYNELIEMLIYAGAHRYEKECEILKLTKIPDQKIMLEKAIQMRATKHKAIMSHLEEISPIVDLVLAYELTHPDDEISQKAE